jgi:hypothetical protein
MVRGETKSVESNQHLDLMDVAAAPEDVPLLAGPAAGAVIECIAPGHPQVVGDLNAYAAEKLVQVSNDCGKNNQAAHHGSDFEIHGSTIGTPTGTKDVVALEKKGQVSKPEIKQPTGKINIVALDQSFELLEASILESKQAESRVRFVQEGGFGFSDDPGIKAGWREAWKNKFIQEKALRAAIERLEFTLAAAIVDLCRVDEEELQRLCLLKQALIAWLRAKLARLNRLIVDLEEGIKGDWKPVTEKVKFASDHLNSLRKRMSRRTKALAKSEMKGSPQAACSKSGTKDFEQPREAPIRSAPCVKGLNASKDLSLQGTGGMEWVAQDCCEGFWPSQGSGQNQTFGLVPLGSVDVDQGQVAEDCGAGPGGRSQERDGAGDKSQPCTVQAFERNLQGGYSPREDMLPPVFVPGLPTGGMGKPSSSLVHDPYVDSHHFTAGQGPRAVDKLDNLLAGNDECLSQEPGLIISEQVELAGRGPVLLQQNSAVSFAASFGRMDASGVLAAKSMRLSLRPELLGVPAVHASPLREKGLRGTTVHLQPEQGSGEEFIPMIDGCSRHGVGIGDYSGNAPQTEAERGEHALRDVLDGLSRRPPALSQEGKSTLGPAGSKTGMEICPQEANVLARTSERVLIVSVVTDRILRTAAFREGRKRPHKGEKSGLWEPKGPERKKDEFSRLVWDRGKPDMGPVERVVRLVFAPVLSMHLGILNQ